MTVAVGTATSPAWVSYLESPIFEGFLVLLGTLVTLTIICVNVQTFIFRGVKHLEDKRQNALRLKLLEHEALSKELEL